MPIWKYTAMEKNKTSLQNENDEVQVLNSIALPYFLWTDGNFPPNL